MAEAAKRDYYEVLGLGRDADAKAIRDAFRRLALQYHPDRNKEAGAEERFKEIAEAYAVLSDPRKRADYDARGFGGLGDLGPEDLFGGIDFENLFGGLGFDLGGGLFERFFSGGNRHRQGPVRGDNLELPLQIPLERVLTGGEETLRFERQLSCPACHGSGARAGTQPHTCTACQGSGREVRKSHEGNVHVPAGHALRGLRRPWQRDRASLRGMPWRWPGAARRQDHAAHPARHRGRHGAARAGPRPAGTCRRRRAR